MTFSHPRIYLIRHGETAWSLSRQHTGKTNIPLTQKGAADAALIGKKLKGHHFEAIFCSPLKRAAATCEIAGFLNRAELDPDLEEWNYGDYEGLKTEEIWKTSPQWNIFCNGAPQGEGLADIEARIKRFLSKIQSLHGDIAVFSHGHFLRALTARFLNLSIQEGRLFALFPSSISILGFEKSEHVIQLWNDTSHLYPS
jgi:broad specificity phosphatase PhoE